MVKLPWFPLYPGDFISDPNVQVLDNEGLGAYFRLLCAQWLAGGTLPHDDAKLAALSHAGDRWDAVRDDVLKFFTRTNDGYVNPRLHAIHEQQVERHTKLSEAGKRGADGRWGNDGQANGRPNSQANGQAYGNQNQNQVEEGEKDGRAISSASDLIKHFCGRYQEKYGEKYPVTKGKDGGLFNCLLTTYSPEEVAAKIDSFFEWGWENSWRSRNGQRETISSFFQCVGEMPAQPPQNAVTPEYEDWTGTAVT